MRRNLVGMIKKSGIIVAVNRQEIIGINGKIPWHYKGDFKRFKQITSGTAVVMGRKTWLSIGCKPLSNRQNIVITSQTTTFPVETALNVQEALSKAQHEFVWFIGGSRVYEDALKICDVVDVTYVPDNFNLNSIEGEITRFPTINENVWKSDQMMVHEFDERLTRRIFVRR